MSTSEGLLCWRPNARDVEDPNGDKIPPQPLEASGVSVEEKAAARHPCFYVAAVVVIVLLLFPVVTIPILFTLYSRSRTTQIYQGATSSAVFTTSVSSATTALSAGSAVSIDAAGLVQKGAGTTIYRNIGPIPADTCPKYLSGTAVFEDKYLVSYKNKFSGVGTVYVMEVNSTKKATALNYASNAYDLYHIVTLNKGTGLFVSISQDDTYTSANTAVVAGKSDKSNGYAITFGAPITYDFAGSFSIDPAITALSNTTFAIAYFGNYPLMAYTRFGAVDPVTLLVTLSAPLAFADDRTYGISFALTNLNAYQYMAVYYNGSSSSSSQTLKAVVMNVTVNAVSGAYVVMPFKKPVSFTGSSLTGVVRATTLDSGDVVVAYSDKNTNNGVTCVLLEVNQYTGLIIFGSQLQITTGTSVQYISTGTVNINLVTIGTGSQFMVMFSDLALNGAIVAAIGESATSILVRASPNYILTTGIATLNTMHAYISLAVAKATPFSSHVAILSSLTDTKCLTAPITDFSLMEILPKPVGLMSSSVSSDSSQLGSVALSGLATGLSGLTVGLTYYATTAGNLVTDGTFYGRDGATQSNSALDSYFYISDVKDKLIVSAESQVGIAIAADTILLRLV